MTTQTKLMLMVVMSVLSWAMFLYPALTDTSEGTYVHAQDGGGSRPVIRPASVSASATPDTTTPVTTDTTSTSTTRKKKLPYPNEVNTPGEPCHADELSTEPLTSFPFWGTTYNTSSTCPTSGMNNQMQMMMFYHNCRHHHSKPELKWKDISCSPTGGVQKGGGQYAVGSRSYDYTWFRWSSLFNVSRGGICFSDKYTWSMHGWIKGCGLTDAAYRRFYGSDDYWRHRLAFDFRDSFYSEVELFLQQEGIAEKPFLAVHLRRGDYVKFCKEITKNYKKLRLAHWKWASKRGSRDLYSKHMDTCFPSTEKVVAGINRLLELHNLEHVVMATTSPDFLPGNADFEKQIKGKVHAFNAKQYEMSSAAFTAVDSVLLARASHKLLNRYSTLSLTGLDLAVIRGWWNNETTWFW